MYVHDVMHVCKMRFRILILVNLVWCKRTTYVQYLSLLPSTKKPALYPLVNTCDCTLWLGWSVLVTSHTLMMNIEIYLCLAWLLSSHEVMTDPVLARDGFSYERAAIEHWLRTHDTSPMTNQRLPSRELVPNNALRSAIRQAERWGPYQVMANAHSRLILISPLTEVSHHFLQERCTSPSTWQLNACACTAASF